MMKTQYCNNSKQKGAVSLFIVIFTALLLTVITISFMQLMVKDQQQATDNDLSESAYDSAVAGVEDAKRALLLQKNCRGDASKRCDDIRTAIAAGKCTTLSTIFGSGDDTETQIKQTEGDTKLEQAYTCVKITSDTLDFLGSVEPTMNATLIPLRAKGSFDKIVISWSQSKSGGTVNLPTNSKELPKVNATTWPQNRPALLRAQLINGNGNFKLSDFDNSGFSNTLFLYPSSTGLVTANFAIDGRRTAPNETQPIKCSSNTASGAYACKATIDLGAAVSGGNETIFLSLAAFYNPTDYKIQLLNGSSTEPIAFDAVQPEVDSTGRANDLFRRVVSRVELEGTFNYPLAALETSGDLCKNFSVTTEPDDYSPNKNCTP